MDANDKCILRAVGISKNPEGLGGGSFEGKGFAYITVKIKGRVDRPSVPLVPTALIL